VDGLVERTVPELLLPLLLFIVELLLLTPELVPLETLLLLYDGLVLIRGLL
jgi:hypothetical protein